MQTYFLIDDGVGMPRWCELRRSETGSYWIDFKARKIPYGEGRPLAHVDGDNIMATVNDVPASVAELERSFAFERLLDPWSDQGWIAPDGKFYGCAYYAHDDIAFALIRKHPAALENLGWVRVHEDSFRTREAFQRITKRQEATILALGFSDAILGSGSKRTFSIDRNQPPPRYAVKAPAETSRRPAAEPSTEPESKSLARLAERLAGCPELAERFGRAFEQVPEVGPGTWDWMLRWDDMDLGGEEKPDTLLASEGIHLRATSFNTVEAAPWPFPEIRIDPDAARILAVEPARRYA